MPTSKKPRKKRSSRKVLVSTVSVTSEDVEKILAAFRDVELKAHIKLPTGKCTRFDMASIAQMVNLAGLSVTVCPWSQEKKNEFADFFNPCVQAMSDVLKRGNAKGRYVCSGDELRAIREAMPYIGMYLQDMAQYEPRKLCKQWLALNYLLEEANGQNKLEDCKSDRSTTSDTPVFWDSVIST